jgi:TatA/E family protein of Tat protein translocase
MNTLALLGDIGASELLVVFAAILLLFGSKRLPEVARGIGRALAELRRASQEFRDQFLEADRDEEDRPRVQGPAARSAPAARDLPADAAHKQDAPPPAAETRPQARKGDRSDDPAG